LSKCKRHRLRRWRQTCSVFGRREGLVGEWIVGGSRWCLSVIGKRIIRCVVRLFSCRRSWFDSRLGFVAIIERVATVGSTLAHFADCSTDTTNDIADACGWSGAKGISAGRWLFCTCIRSCAKGIVGGRFLFHFWFFPASGCFTEGVIARRRGRLCGRRLSKGVVSSWFLGRLFPSGRHFSWGFAEGIITSRGWFFTRWLTAEGIVPSRLCGWLAAKWIVATTHGGLCRCFCTERIFGLGGAFFYPDVGWRGGTFRRWLRRADTEAIVAEWISFGTGWHNAFVDHFARGRNVGGSGGTKHRLLGLDLLSVFIAPLALGELSLLILDLFDLADALNRQSLHSLHTFQSAADGITIAAAGHFQLRPLGEVKPCIFRATELR
jgi:hypothetical protein